MVCLTYFSPRSFPIVVARNEITLGSVNVRFDDKKNKTIHSPVIGTAVPKTTAPTTYAPYIIASIPAKIESTPAAKTSVTISNNATQDAFDVGIPFFVI